MPIQAPTISRGELYGGNEGNYADVEEASGPQAGGTSPALFWVAAAVVLIIIRLVWESAD